MTILGLRTAEAQAPAAQLPNFLFLQPTDRITGFIDDEERAVLPGNRHPFAIPLNDAGAVAPDYVLHRMILVLLPDAAQQRALDAFVDNQHDPESAYYHHWLTPEQFGQRFGVSESDVAQVSGWLESYGFQIEEIPQGHLSIIFSGTARAVQSAFHTPIHFYTVNGEFHHANAEDPNIPAALAQVVGGVVSLHDFRSEPAHSAIRQASPQYNSGGSHYLAPADLAVIYDVAPLYQQAINGGGESIAIVARSNIKVNDVRKFRSAFALPANDPQIIVNGVDPGIFSSSEETEADLDVEWSGAVAKNATIKVVVSKSTNSSDGVDLSAQYIVNHNLAPVMSTSFGLCERALGSAGNLFLNSLWQQAAAQGITVLVSAGDNGAAGCDSPSSPTAVGGRAVNGLCSTPYSICVGGTALNDFGHPSLYWSSSNGTGTQASAQSYIPETVWNESGPGAGLWAGSGGASSLYLKPSWQTGAGVPADGKRDVPDVSLAAAAHDGYLIVQEGGVYVVGGTSAAAPSFAGLMALVAQHMAAREGNANTVFYALANKQRAGGAPVFHDISNGNNSVPGLAGFKAGTGYDQASGLGSVDATVFVEHWRDATIASTFEATTSARSVSVAAGSYNSITVNTAGSGDFNAPVALSLSGLPRGVTAEFTPSTVPPPGSGSSVLRISVGSGTKPGVHSFSLLATSGATQRSFSISLSIVP